MKYLNHPLAKVLLGFFGLFVVLALVLISHSQLSSLLTTTPPATQLAAVGASDTDNVPGWTPPIGIPEPSFGIHESYRMYDDPANRNPALTYTENSEHGFYTHYVDNTNASSTDTNNIYGTAEKPRSSIPNPLPAGSVVEIHNGATPNGDRYWVIADGNSTKPVFVRGIDISNKPVLARKVHALGQYLIIENLEFNSAKGSVSTGVGIRPMASGQVHSEWDAHHIAVRDIKIVGPGTFKNGGGISGDSPDSRPVHDIVAYNNDISYVGQYDAPAEDDASSFSFQINVNNLWIVDNVAHHTGGDGVILAHGAKYTTHHVYIGRNYFHHHRENGIDLKEATDVVVSENVIRSHYPVSSSSGEAIAVHYGSNGDYGTRRVWILNNVISDAQFGVASTEAWDLYVIGNIISDMREMRPSFSLLNGVYREGAAVQAYGTRGIYIVNNTINNCFTGVELMPPGKDLSVVQVVNNVVSELIPGYNGTDRSDHLTFSSDGSVPAKQAAVVDNNIWYQPAGAAHLYYSNAVLTLPEWRALTGKSEHDVEADPLTAARDAGTTSDVYQIFSDLYGGLDINYGFQSMPDPNDPKTWTFVHRPQGSAWDIGAYEYDAGTPPTPEPPAPDPTPATTTPSEPPPPPAPVVHHGGGGGGGGPAKLKATTTLPLDRAALIQQLQRQLLALLQQLLQMMLAQKR